MYKQYENHAKAIELECKTVARHDPTDHADWWSHLQAKLVYIDRRKGVLDLSHVPSPEEIEQGLLGGRAQVIECDQGKRIIGDPVAIKPRTPPSEIALFDLESGRIPPLENPTGKGTGPKSTREFSFLVMVRSETTDQSRGDGQASAGDGTATSSGAGVSGRPEKAQPSRDPARYVLVRSGLPEFGGEGSLFVSVDTMERVALLRYLSLENHANVMPVQETFIGSAAPLVPWWIPEVVIHYGVHPYTAWYISPPHTVTLRRVFSQGKHSKFAEVSPRERALWLLQLLEAIEYLHGRGVVHMKISDDTIFVASDGRLVLGGLSYCYPVFDGGKLSELYEGLEKIDNDLSFKQDIAHGSAGVFTKEANETEMYRAQRAREVGSGCANESDSDWPLGPLTDLPGDWAPKWPDADPVEPFSGSGFGSKDLTFDGQGCGAMCHYGLLTWVAPEIAKPPAARDLRRPIPYREIFQKSSAWSAAKLVTELSPDNYFSYFSGNLDRPLLPGHDRSVALQRITRQYRSNKHSETHHRAIAQDLLQMQNLEDLFGGQLLRGLLQGLLEDHPTDRLCSKAAIRALRVLLFGPQSWKQIRAFAQQDEATLRDAEQFINLQIKAAGVLDTCSRQGDPAETVVSTDNVSPGPPSCVSFGLLTHRYHLPRTLSCLDAYEQFGWGDRRLFYSETCMWERQLRYDWLLGSGSIENKARKLCKECTALVQAIRTHMPGVTIGRPERLDRIMRLDQWKHAVHRPN